MKENNKVLMVALAGFLVLLAWESVHQVSCSVLIFPAAISVMIGVGVMEFSVKRRECLAKSYFIEGTLPYRLFNSKKLIIIKSLLLSILLGTSLAIAAVTWNAKTLAILLLDIFVLRWIYSKALAVMSGSIKERVKYAIAKDVSVSFNTFLLTVLILIGEFYSPIPAYVSDSLQATVDLAYGAYSSECGITNFFLKVNAEKDALNWWSMLSVNAHIYDARTKLLAWTAFLLSNSLAAYGYSRYMMQLIDFKRLFGDNNAQQ